MPGKIVQNAGRQGKIALVQSGAAGMNQPIGTYESPDGSTLQGIGPGFPHSPLGTDALASTLDRLPPGPGTDREKTMKQRTILQDFEWYLPDDGQFWNKTAAEAQHLADLGFTDIWLPPAYKGQAGIHDVGYGVYDQYDLGEFDQKGSVPTKYGTKDQYLAAIRALQSAGLQVLADIVLNHRMGADATETVEAVRSDSQDRTQSLEETSIQAWTRFTFPGRKGKYSDFQWNWTHFSGVDWDESQDRSAVFRFADKNWARKVDKENGNFDYLMGANLDMSSPEVIRELDRWGRWYLDFTGVDGFRLDAVKHISFSFFTHWLTKLRQDTGRELPAVGEYWNPDVDTLCSFLDRSGQVMSLFDVPLHMHLFQASEAGRNFDLRTLLQDTLVARRPECAATFVDNHDTQPGQALQSWVQGWFKPLAYALILLREAGTPCVFYGDLYGIPHDNIPPVPGLEAMLRARQRYAWGRETSYIERPDMIGWTRAGVPEIPGSGMAVVLSNGESGALLMCLGTDHAGERFWDCTGNCPGRLVLDETGSAEFPVNGGKVSVWVPEDPVPPIPATPIRPAAFAGIPLDGVPENR